MGILVFSCGTSHAADTAPHDAGAFFTHGCKRQFFTQDPVVQPCKAFKFFRGGVMRLGRA
jgi:hypothetical protein